MSMTEVQVAENVKKLKGLIEVLKAKELKGLIKAGSASKALSLVSWAESGRSLSEQQQQFVGRLINRAIRRHRDAQIVQVGGASAPPVDVNALVDAVASKVQAHYFDEIASKIEARVLEQIEKRAPRKVEISIAPAGGGKTYKLSDAPRHHMFERLLRAATSRVNGMVPGIFLQGEASSGKTTGARMLAETLKQKWHFNGAISFPHEMLGFIDGAGKYHTTPFRDAYEKGGVYTFDEVDRSDPVALLAVNPHLAGDVATFPDKQVKRHPDCVIVCTANTWGLGADANYSGATKLDAAFLSRFPVRINWDIDPDLEAAIVPNAAWLARVRQARVKARAAGLKVMIDTRIAQAGASLIAAGFTMDEAASMTYLANLKPDQRVLVGE